MTGYHRAAMADPRIPAAMPPAATESPAVPFSTIVGRPPWRWPDGARLAVCVLLYVEHWELQPPPDAQRDPRHVGEFGSFFPDYRTWSQREYGNRIGVFRVLEVLDRLGIAPAVPVNTMAIEACPALIDALRTRKVEFLGHGVAATRMQTSRLSEPDERAMIAACAASVERIGSGRPRGWVGQDFAESIGTPQLLAEAGFEYVLDWPNDDQPYRLRTQPAMWSLPNHSEWDDVQLLWHRRVAMPQYPALIEAAAVRLAEEGASSARMMTIGLHPWLAGMASRVRYVREAMERVCTIPGVWFAQPHAIVAATQADRVPPGDSSG